MSHIVTATDFSERSLHALRAAAKMASQHRDQLTILHVLEELGDGYGWLLLAEPPDKIEAQMKEQAKTKLLNLCRDQLAAIDPDLSFNLRVEVGSPAEQILRVAKELQARQIVVGTLGHGKILSTFLGSTANQLIRWSELPVLVVPPEHADLSFQRILAPVESSAVSRATLLHAVELARAFSGKITLLHAVGLPVVMGSEPSFTNTIVPETIEELITRHRENLEGVVQALEIGDVVDKIDVWTMDPAQAISQAAKEQDVELICMGSHGRRGLMRFLLGNTAERVLRRAPCPVMILRKEADKPLYGEHDAPEEPSMG